MTIEDSIKNILATLAGVNTSAVTIISIDVYRNDRRLLQESSIIVDFSIKLSKNETKNSSIIEESLTTQNIAGKIQSSSDETMRSILPDGVIVYTVLTIDNGEVIDDVYGEDGGVSIILLFIVIIVSVVIVVGTPITVCYVYSISTKMKASIDFESHQGCNVRDQDFWDFTHEKAHHTKLRDFNMQRDKDLFRNLPFYSEKEHVNTTPSIHPHKPRILDYSMI